MPLGAGWLDEGGSARLCFSFLSSDVWALRQAGLNMIRLWGGAAVARDAFYDACDVAGVMVRHLNSSPKFCSRVRNLDLLGTCIALYPVMTSQTGNVC